MKVASLSTEGIGVVIARTVPPTREGGSPFYCITHGNLGRARWEVRIPLNQQDYAANPKAPKIELYDDDFDLSILDHKRDINGNPSLILRKGVPDNRYLLLWDLSPGTGGGALYSVCGEARTLTWGVTTEAEGSKRGFARCPIVLVEGPCELTWYREGSVHGQQRAWHALYDGERWAIGPMQEDWNRVQSKLSLTGGCRG